MEDIGAGYDESSQILASLRMGTAFRFKVTIRGLTVALRPLSMSEDVKVLSEVYDQLNRNPVMKNDQFYESTLKAALTLQQASSSKPGETDFQLTTNELMKWTGDEVQKLFKEYVAIRDRCNPDMEKMEPEQMNRIVDMLKKSPREDWGLMLNELSFSQLKDIISSLITSD